MPYSLRKGFTLIELLVVIAIIAILAAILFPVFAQAKAMAKKAAAISNFKQQDLAYPMYNTDLDDTEPLVTYNLTYSVNPNQAGGPDSIPQLQVYPYVKNMFVYNDPMDPASDHDRIYIEQAVDPDGLPYAAAQTLFNYLYKSDFGLNWDAVCPLYIINGANVPRSITTTAIANPAKLIFGIDSLWDRTAQGAPFGGGNDAVDEPCFFDQDGEFNLYDWQGAQEYYWYGGWNPTTPLAWAVFGGVWPWHTNGTITVIGFADGHAKAMNIGNVPVGCPVRDGSSGQVTSQSAYMWSWRG